MHQSRSRARLTLAHICLGAAFSSKPAVATSTAAAVATATVSASPASPAAAWHGCGHQHHDNYAGAANRYRVAANCDNRRGILECITMPSR